MCGIGGFFGKNEELLRKMMAAAKFRGPDGDGIYLDDNISIGHNLLAITDEPGISTQPVEFGDLVLAYNGEIYNYRNLRLKLTEYQFKTDTDTEVLLYGLHKYGLDFLKKIDGMYGLALWNKKERSLYLARDSGGVKPLYYFHSGKSFAFASSFKSLFEFTDCKKIINKDKIPILRSIGYLPAPFTLVKDIYKICPGEVLKFNENGSKSTVFIIRDEPQEYNYEPETFRDLIAISVKQCLMGKRKIGLFLSGGMDSSVILYEASKYLDEVHTFTTKFETPHKKFNSDADVAAKFAKEFKNVIHHELKITFLDFIRAADPAMLALDEPRYNRNSPIYYLTNKFMADNGIVVTLSGDGGDEVFTGYPRHKNVKKATIDEWFDITGFKTQKSQKKTICKIIQHQPSIYSDPVNQFLYLERKNHLCEDYLIRNDNFGMAFSMEGRFPFTIQSFVNKIGHIAPNIKMKGQKFLIREAYKNLLPDYILNKEKTGWSIPLEWIRDRKFMKLINKIQDKNYHKPVKSLTKSTHQKEMMTNFYYLVWAKQHGMSL